MAITTLYEDETKRIVQLGTDYSDGIYQCNAELASDGVTILEMKSHSKPHQLYLTKEEMDKLAAAWIAHQTDLRIRADEAEKRAKNMQTEAQQAKQSIVEEIGGILIECPAIQITNVPEASEPGVKLVCIPEIPSARYYAYGEQQLLECVKDAQAVWRHHQEQQTKTQALS